MKLFSRHLRGYLVLVFFLLFACDGSGRKIIEQNEFESKVASNYLTLQSQQIQSMKARIYIDSVRKLVNFAHTVDLDDYFDHLKGTPEYRLMFPGLKKSLETKGEKGDAIYFQSHFKAGRWENEIRGLGGVNGSEFNETVGITVFSALLGFEISVLDVMVFSSFLSQVPPIQPYWGAPQRIQTKETRHGFATLLEWQKGNDKTYREIIYDSNLKILNLKNWKKNRNMPFSSYAPQFSKKKRKVFGDRDQRTRRRDLSRL